MASFFSFKVSKRPICFLLLIVLCLSLAGRESCLRYLLHCCESLCMPLQTGSAKFLLLFLKVSATLCFLHGLSLENCGKNLPWTMCASLLWLWYKGMTRVSTRKYGYRFVSVKGRTQFFPKAEEVISRLFLANSVPLYALTCQNRYASTVPQKGPGACCLSHPSFSQSLAVREGDGKGVSAQNQLAGGDRREIMK